MFGLAPGEVRPNYCKVRWGNLEEAQSISSIGLKSLWVLLINFLVDFNLVISCYFCFVAIIPVPGDDVGHGLKASLWSMASPRDFPRHRHSGINRFPRLLRRPGGPPCRGLIACWRPAYPRPGPSGASLGGHLRFGRCFPPGCLRRPRGVSLRGAYYRLGARSARRLRRRQWCFPARGPLCPLLLLDLRRASAGPWSSLRVPFCRPGWGSTPARLPPLPRWSSPRPYYAPLLAIFGSDFPPGPSVAGGFRQGPCPRWVDSAGFALRRWSSSVAFIRGVANSPGPPPFRRWFSAPGAYYPLVGRLHRPALPVARLPPRGLLCPLGSARAASLAGVPPLRAFYFGSDYRPALRRPPSGFPSRGPIIRVG